MMKKALQKLQSAGLRTTKTRKRIIRLMRKSEHPLTVAEIYNHFKRNGEEVSRSTIYRQLDSLVKYKVIAKSDVSGDADHFEADKKHHHHFTCNNCEDVICLTDIGFEQEIKKIEQKIEQLGVTPTEHSFSFSGKCQNCT
jgi:Fur family ferric uptake transcriptional regulator